MSANHRLFCNLNNAYFFKLKKALHCFASVPGRVPGCPGGLPATGARVQGFATAISRFCKQHSWSSSQNRSELALPSTELGLVPCAAQGFHAVPVAALGWQARPERMNSERGQRGQAGAAAGGAAAGAGPGGREAKWISLCSWQRSWDSSLSRLFCFS